MVDDDDGEGRHFSWNIGDATGTRRFPKVPSDEGRKLMQSGVFGAYDRREPTSSRKALARRLLDRELGLGDPMGEQRNQGLMAQVGSTTCRILRVLKANSMCVVDDTVDQTRDGHPLRGSRLLWPVFRRRQFLLCLCQGKSFYADAPCGPLFPDTLPARTSKFASTTRQVHTTGNITRPSTTPLDNGP